MVSTTVSVTIVASTTSFKLITGIIKVIGIKCSQRVIAIEKLANFHVRLQGEKDNSI